MQNEFEKKVQHQLDEFSINPSEEVWLRVEKNIRQQKRKKRLIVFWWTAAIVLIVGGGLTLSVLNRDKVTSDLLSKVIAENNRSLPIKKQSSIEKAKQTNTTTQHPDGATTPANDTLNLNNTLPGNKQQIFMEKQGGSQNFKGSQQSNHTSQLKGTGIPSNSTASSNYQGGSNKRMARENFASRLSIEPSKIVSSSLKVQPITASQNENQTNDLVNDVAKQQTIVNSKNKVAEIPNTLIEVVPSTQNIQTLQADTSVVKSADSIATILFAQEIPVPKKESITVISSIKKKDNKTPFGSKWRFGIYASAGIADNVSKVPLGSNKMLNDAAYSTPANSTTSTVALPVIKLNYTKGFAGVIGAFASKPISQNFGISTGLNFQYYSTKTTTGGKVNTQRIVYDTLTGSSSMVREYYIPIDRMQANFSQGPSTFTNSYYFLQMPVDLTYLFSRNNPQAGMFSVGLTSGILSGSKALYYNRLDRITYVDKQQFKKFQLSAQAGISISIINSKKYLLQAGPQVMAGLNNLSKNVYNSNQHLLYLGIGTKVAFK